MYKIYNFRVVDTLCGRGDAVIAARNPEEAVSQLKDYFTNHKYNPLGQGTEICLRSIEEIEETGRLCASKGVIYENLIGKP